MQPWFLKGVEMGTVFSVFLVIGILSGRVSLVGARRGIQHRNVFRAFIAALATFVSLSLIVWGFATLPWYWPLAIFLIASFCSGLVITRRNWPTWFSIAAILDAIAAAGGLYLWIWHWPF